jgi:hypothetical protein
MWSGLFILDPDPEYLPIPDPGSRIQGSKRHRILYPGSGSATLVRNQSQVHSKFIWINILFIKSVYRFKNRSFLNNLRRMWWGPADQTVNSWCPARERSQLAEASS